MKLPNGTRMCVYDVTWSSWKLISNSYVGPGEFYCEYGDLIIKHNRRPANKEIPAISQNPVRFYPW